MKKLFTLVALSLAVLSPSATAASPPKSCRGIYTADTSLATAVNACAKTVKNSTGNKSVVKRAKKTQGKKAKGKKKTQKASTSRTTALSFVAQLASGRSSDLTPGAVASIQGRNFTSNTCVAAAGSLPLKLCGIEVILRGERLPAVRAPLSLVTPSRIELQVPEQLAPGRVTLKIVRDGRITVNDTPITITSSGFSPFEQPNTTGPLCSRLLREEEGNTAGDRSEESFIPVTPTNPTQAGDLVRCYGTGLGAVSPKPFSGTLISAEHLRSDRELTVHVRYPDTTNDDRLLRGRVYHAGRKKMAVGVDEILFSLPFVQAELLFGNNLHVALCEHEADKHFAPANRCGKDFALPYQVTPFNNTLGAYPDYERSFPSNRLNCSGDLLKCAELAQKEGYPAVLMDQGRVHYRYESPKEIVDSALILKSADVRELKTEVYPGQTFPTRVVSLRHNEVFLDNSTQPECTGAPHPALQGLTPQSDELLVLMPGGTVTVGQTLVTSEALIPSPTPGVYLLEPLPCSPQAYTLRHPLGMYISDTRAPSPGEAPIEVIRSLPGNRDIQHPLRYLDIVIPFEPLRALGYNPGAYLLQDFRQALLNLDGTPTESAPHTEQLAWITSDDEPQDPKKEDHFKQDNCWNNYHLPTREENGKRILEFAFDSSSFEFATAIAPSVDIQTIYSSFQNALNVWSDGLAKYGGNAPITFRLTPFNSLNAPDPSDGKKVVVQYSPKFDSSGSPSDQSKELAVVHPLTGKMRVRPRLFDLMEEAPGQTNVNAVELLTLVFFHEIGHVLGLEHSSKEKSPMHAKTLYPLADSYILDDFFAALHVITKPAGERRFCKFEDPFQSPATNDIADREWVDERSYNPKYPQIAYTPGCSVHAGIYKRTSYTWGKKIDGKYGWLISGSEIFQVDCADTVTILEKNDE